MLELRSQNLDGVIVIVHVPESVELALPTGLDVVPLDVEVLVSVRPES